jgi:REP element-mobilizing transposase RayT
MPDHVHALVRGVREDSDFLKWLDLWRQLSGFWWQSRHHTPLWQEGYWDYTLRDDDALMSVASYIVWNPVAGGLVASPADYPYTFSEAFTIEEIAAVAPRKPPVGDL